jgi:hypothetical protein
MGARGGVDIPASDMPGVKSHLGKHYAQFEKTPPWESKDYSKGLIYTDEAEQALAACDSLIVRTKELASLRTKEGRVLSSANRERMKRLLNSLSEVATDLKELLDATEPVDQEKLAQAILILTRIKRNLEV